MKLLAVLQYPQFDPFIFRWGKVGLSWYASIYAGSFVAGYFILRRRFRKHLFRLPDPADLSLLITYIFYGVVLGARVFYVLFYNLHYFVQNPLEIPAIWHGGLSFHGGLAGGWLALWFFGRKHHVSVLHLADNVTLCVPIGLGFGRIANFINGELYGRVTSPDLPWAMVFPGGGPLPRHPSQLYECILEGPVLFTIIWLTLRRQPKDGIATAVGIIAYGVLRFIEEFFREPDPQLGYLFKYFSMGQLLCITMLLVGFGMLVAVRRRS